MARPKSPALIYASGGLSAPRMAHPGTLGLLAEILTIKPAALYENQVQKIVPLPFRKVSAFPIPKEQAGYGLDPFKQTFA